MQYYADMHVSVDRTRHHAMPGRKEPSRFQSISECDSPNLVNTCGIKHPSQERGGDKVFITGLFLDNASEYC